MLQSRQPPTYCGASVLTFDSNAVRLEETSPREGRMMIFNFSSEEVTKAWWADTKYQKLSALRHAATGMEFQRGWYIFEIGFWRICADTVTPARRRSPAPHLRCEAREKAL